MTQHLAEWIAYHHIVGVDHFFLYDHDLEHDLADNAPLRTLVARGLVTVVPWKLRMPERQSCLGIGVRMRGCPCGRACGGKRLAAAHLIEHWNREQVAALNDCVHRFGAATTWFVMHDDDEYLLPRGPYRTLPDVLAAYPNASNVYLMSQLMWSSDRHRPNELAIERFRRVALDPSRERNKYFQRSATAGLINVHYSMYDRNGTRDVAVTQVPWLDPAREAVLRHLRVRPYVALNTTLLLERSSVDDLAAYAPLVRRLLDTVGAL